MAHNPRSATIGDDGTIRFTPPGTQNSLAARAPQLPRQNLTTAWYSARFITNDFVRNLQASLPAGIFFETFASHPKPLRKLWQTQCTIEPGRTVRVPGHNEAAWRLYACVDGHTPHDKIVKYNTVVSQDSMPIPLIAVPGGYVADRAISTAIPSQASRSVPLPNAVLPISRRTVPTGPRNALASKGFHEAWQDARYVDSSYFTQFQGTIPMNTYVESSIPAAGRSPARRFLWVARCDIDSSKMPGGRMPLPWKSSMYWMRVESLIGSTPPEKIQASQRRTEEMIRERQEARRPENISRNQVRPATMRPPKTEDRGRLSAHPRTGRRSRAWQPYSESAEPKRNPYRTQSIPDLSRYAGSKRSIPTM